MDSPFGLLAELTYRCPLACAYCSNPTNLAGYTDELSTSEWQKVLTEPAIWGSCSATFPAESRCCAETSWRSSKPPVT